MDAAKKRFLSEGFQSTSLTDIARDVHLSLAGLLHYFPTKVDLLLAVLDERDKEYEPFLKEGTLNWVEFIALLKTVNRRNMETPEIIRAFSLLNAESLLDHHPARRWFYNRTLQLRDHMAYALNQGVEAGELRPDIDPQALATEIISIMDGLQMVWLRLPQSTDMGVIFEAYLDRLMKSSQA
ncbi:TetR family transcriptional regulator [Allorhizobium undicola]|uniref:TetR family transcriptional regulator n=1 Tax=Allorhizobium undicola TaxID=78527 RepID=UPI003D3590F0